MVHSGTLDEAPQAEEMKFPLNAGSGSALRGRGTLVIRFHSKSHWSCTPPPRMFVFMYEWTSVWACVRRCLNRLLVRLCEFVCRHLRRLVCASICQRFCARRNTSVQGLTELCAQAGLSACWLIYLRVGLQRASESAGCGSLSFLFLF